SRMKNRLLPLLACAALLITTPALALVAADRAEPELNPLPVAPPAGTCSPAGFTIVKTGEGYVLKGALETPSPNYKYGFENGILTLVAPEGTQLTVIDSLAIQLALPETASQGVSIPVKKTFNWGPDNITCELSAKNGVEE
ncbi:MAG: hypothetical protein K0R10_2898, partial [Alphaproteobacteria bacterium]|nr:hypothetical protein [Alphaproteobacteria bacterium]